MEVGDIYTVCAAVKHPLLNLLCNSSRYTVGTCLSSLMEDSLKICSKKAARQPDRPCLICETPSATASAEEHFTRICLMRKFQPRELPRMPKMVRHFLVPVHITNSEHSEHLHTSPEWVGKSQIWVVALPFDPPEGSLGNRLKSPSSSKWLDGSNYYIGPSTMQEFMRLCQEKAEAWEAQSRPAYRQDAEDVTRWKTTRRAPQKFIPVQEEDEIVDVVTQDLQDFSMKSEVASVTSDAASTMSKSSVKSVKMLGLMRLRAGAMLKTRLSQAFFSRG